MDADFGYLDGDDCGFGYLDDGGTFELLVVADAASPTPDVGIGSPLGFTFTLQVVGGTQTNVQVVLTSTNLGIKPAEVGSDPTKLAYSTSAPGSTVTFDSVTHTWTMTWASLAVGTYTINLGPYWSTGTGDQLDCASPGLAGATIAASSNQVASSTPTSSTWNVDGFDPQLAVAIANVSPASSANTSTTLTWDAQITFPSGGSQTTCSVEIYVHYPTGGRPASAPTFVSMPSGWTPGTWSNSVADYWSVICSAASQAPGTITFSLSTSTGSVAGTEVLGCDGATSVEQTNAGESAPSTTYNETITAAPSWTVDATDGFAYPATATEWTAFNSAKSLTTGNPTHLHNCQDVGPGAADAIGTDNLSESGTGITYQQAVPGLSRLAIKIPSPGGSTFLQQGDLNASTDNQFALICARLAVTNGRYFAGYGTTPAVRLFTTSTTALFSVSTNGASVSGTAADTNNHSYFFNADRGASLAAGGYEGQYLTPTWAPASTGALTSFGSVSGGASCAPYMWYIARWADSPTGTWTQSTTRALLQAQGKTVAW